MRRLPVSPEGRADSSRACSPADGQRIEAGRSDERRLERAPAGPERPHSSRPPPRRFRANLSLTMIATARRSTDMLDVAMIGAGAIATQGYLPAVAELDGADVRWIVDVDESRASRLAEEFDAAGYATDHREVLDDADAAILATPPTFHDEIAEACLRSGVHVLTEKPVATTSRRAEELVALGEDRGLHYAVSRQFRDAPACLLLERWTSSGGIGTVRSFEVRFGDPTEWAFASDYRLRRSLAGGGALTDKGPHVLDVLVWLFDGWFEVDRYEDDSFGGLEANARAELSVRPGGIRGTLEVSGSRDLNDEIAITGAEGRITAGPGGDAATLHDFRTGEEIRLEMPSAGSTSYLVRVGMQARRFVESIRTGEPTYVPASDGVDVLRLVEDCYESRERLANPWETIGIEDPAATDETAPIDVPAEPGSPTGGR